jgi:hypothetical protein
MSRALTPAAAKCSRQVSTTAMTSRSSASAALRFSANRALIDSALSSVDSPSLIPTRIG